tara:strand:- start:18 stop:476 length:459 start_codon:yes stop_codon:yes gene_type:complete
MQYDTAENVYQHPQNRFVGSFLGNPPMNFVEGTLKKDGEKVFIESGSGVLPVPSALAAPVDGGSGLVAGFRPETLSISGADDEYSFSAQVIAVEPQGPESVVTARLGDTHVKVVVPSDSEATSVETISLTPNFDLLALFDSESGVRLMTRGE